MENWMNGEIGEWVNGMTEEYKNSRIYFVHKSQHILNAQNCFIYLEDDVFTFHHATQTCIVLLHGAFFALSLI